MKRFIKIAKKNNLKIIEDSSESLGSFYNNKHSGTYGDIGVFSFNGNKIISTGGGGGIVVTDSYDIAKKIKHLTTTAKIDSENYIHDEVGYNYRLVNILAAVGCAQFEKLNEILEKEKIFMTST